MSGKEGLTPIPVMFRTYYDTKANLDLLTGLLDGEIAWATDESILYRQNGNGAANWVSISALTGVGAPLVVDRFNTTRGLPAVGTFFSEVQRLNDGGVAAVTYGSNLNEYAEVLLEGAFWFNQFRQFGWVTNTGDGRWKIQTLNPATLAWEDWVTDIPVRITGDWGNWTAGALRLVCGVRLVITTLDTCGTNVIAELECRYA